MKINISKYKWLIVWPLLPSQLFLWFAGQWLQFCEGLSLYAVMVKTHRLRVSLNVWLFFMDSVGGDTGLNIDHWIRTKFSSHR